MRTSIRHALSTLAAIAMMCGLTLVGAAPAQAATTIDLSVSATTVTEGETITLTWSTTEASAVVANLDWGGGKNLSGSEQLTMYGVGTKTYMLTALDSNGSSAATDTVTVNVLAAPITPAPVTFNGCNVTVPSTPNVTYFVDYGDEDIEPLEADTYPGSYFDTGGDPVLFYAVAGDGFSFADDAVTEWEYTTPEECLGEAELVTVTAGCHEATFTSLVDVTIGVAYGDGDLPAPDGEFDLAAGAVHTVETDRDVLYFEAYGEFDEFQSGELDVTTDCAVDPADGDHPTVAPAAGV